MSNPNLSQDPNTPQEPTTEPIATPTSDNGFAAPSAGQSSRPAPQYGQYAPTSPQTQQPQYGQFSAPTGQADAHGQASSAPQYGQQQPQYGVQAPQGYSAPPLQGAPIGAFNNFATALKPGIIPLRPLNLGEIYDGAFGAIRKAPGVMLGLVGVIVMFFVALAVVFSYVVSPWLTNTALFQDINDFEDALGTTLGSAQSLSMEMLVTFAVPIATVIATGAVVVAIGQLVLNKSVTISQAWVKLAPRILPLFGIMLLISVVFPMLIGLAVALLSALAFTLNETLGWFVVVLGFIASAIVFIVLQIRWIFAPSILVLEEQGVVASLKRSSALVKGSFWRIVGIYVLTSLVLSLIIGTAGGLILGFVSFGAGTGFMDSWAYSVLYAVIQGLISTLSVSVLSAVITLLYIDVRMRKEALDLELIAAAGK